MCSTPKISTTSTTTEESEIIKTATQADASVQKSSASNSTKGLVSENVRTTNLGLDDEVVTSKKKLLGE